MSEGSIDPARLVPVLHYDGTPITERFITNAIAEKLSVLTVTPLRKAVP
jgi:2-oxoglutarate ferredoxin oxidoreductase subunit alpha